MLKPQCWKPPGHYLCTPEPGRLSCIISIHKDVKSDAYPVAVSQKVTKNLPVSFYSPTPRFSLAKTGNRLGLCHGRFHLHWLIWAVKHVKKARITKWKILAHIGTGTHYLSLTRLFKLLLSVSEEKTKMVWVNEGQRVTIIAHMSQRLTSTKKPSFCNS